MRLEARAEETGDEHVRETIRWCANGAAPFIVAVVIHHHNCASENEGAAATTAAEAFSGRFLVSALSLRTRKVLAAAAAA